ncbi:uncharacterized protein LOC128239949 [Mya arenaria]|nr:uncharacterized protein LOC128239949 [Mya arenaria]
MGCHWLSSCFGGKKRAKGSEGRQYECSCTPSAISFIAERARERVVSEADIECIHQRGDNGNNAETTIEDCLRCSDVEIGISQVSWDPSDCKNIKDDQSYGVSMCTDYVDGYKRTSVGSQQTKDINVTENKTAVSEDSTTVVFSSKHTCINLGANSKKCSFRKSVEEQFYHELLLKAQLEFSQSELEDIQNGVEEIVWKILHIFDSKSIGATFSRVIQTGSYYDNTKTCQPDEFDFLAVMEDISGQQFLTKRKCVDRPGYCHLEAKDKTALSDHSFDSSWQLKHSSFRAFFLNLVHTIMRETVNGEIIDKTSGTLTVINYAVAVNGPQCTLRLKWKSRSKDRTLSISVDICPAVEVSDVSELVHENEVADKSLYTEMIKADKCHLIPRPVKSCQFCFKLVFAKADRETIMDLSASHKNCLMILKYLASHVKKAKPRLRKFFNSFALKMAVLHHSFECESERKMDHISQMGGCFMAVLDVLLKGLVKQPPCMPSVFITGHNVWNSTSLRPKQDTHIVMESVRILEDFKEFFYQLASCDSDLETLHCRLIGICIK